MPPVELEDDEYEVEEPVADAALMAMMPMSFGKQDKKRDLSASFAKTKRVNVTEKRVLTFRQETKQEKQAPAKVVANPVNDDDSESSDDMIGPMPAQEKDLEEEDEEEDDDDEFPVSHEVVLKDHHKVFPALAKL